jgi:Baseplate J-like protein
VKTLAKLLYVEADEEITDLVDRLRDLSLEEEVTFIVPDRARALQSAMSFRLLKRYADSYGKRVNLVSGDARLQAMSLEAGFNAYPSLAAYDRGTEAHQPGTVETPAQPPSQTSHQPSADPQAVATLDRPRQAAVVSAAPKKAPVPAKPSATGPTFKNYRPYVIGAAVAIVLALLVGILYLPTANATLLVSGTPVKQDTTLLGVPGITSASGNQFPTKAIHGTESQTLPGTPTGQKQIDAVKASGQVTIKMRCSDCAFPIGAGADVYTGTDNKHYVTQKAVTATPQGVSVQVVAVQAGASGNTGSGTIQYFQNDLYNAIASVTNPQAIGGGADARTATVIQQSDIDSIRDVYAKDAVPRVTDQLTSKAQGQKLVLVGNGVAATAKADHKVGEEVNGFTVTITVAGDGVAFDDKTVKQMLKSALQHKLASGTQLTANSNLTYDAIDASADGHVTLNGHASGFYTPVFLESNIRSHLKGMSPSKAHAFLQSLPNVVDARVAQSPFGLPWLPLFSSRISLKIQEVSGSSGA